MTHSDEKLSAFLDGELDADETAELKNAIDANPALKARLQSLDAADAMIRNVYSSIDQSPMPDSVMALLDAAASDDGALSSANVVDLAVRRKPGAAAPVWMAPLAASLALVAGIGLGAGLFSKSEPAGAIRIAGVIEPSSPLFDIIETGPSAVAVNTGHARVTPIVTFRGVDGGYCREFTSRDEAAGLRAIACREGAVWRVKIAVADPALSAGEGYSTAAGASLAFEDYANQLIAGDALGAEEEARLIENGWPR